MLEDIKIAAYKGVTNYLAPNDIQTLRQWYERFSDIKYIDDENLVSLMYELYIREDIDFRPCEDYNVIVSSLAEKYCFNSTNFLNMYQQYRKILFGE